MNVLLSRARAYKRVESYDEAEKDIVDVIQKVTDPHLYDEAVSLWHEVEQAKQARVKRKAEAQLEEANRLISEGSAAEGATKANEVLASSNDPEIWEKARAILARNRQTGFALVDVGIRDFYTTLRSIIGWVLALIEALARTGIFVFGATGWSTCSPSLARQEKGKLVVWRYRR